MPFSNQKKSLMTMTHQRDKPHQLTREMVLSLKSVENSENGRRTKLSFSSEEPYERWFGLEILDHKESSVNINRLRDIGCVLFNHNRDAVIGRILSATINGSRGEAEIEFDSDELSERIYQKVKNKTLKGVSVGYVVNRYEVVKEGKKSSDGRFSGPCYVATDWEPYEISIVSVPADPTVGVGREIEAAQQRKVTEKMDLYRAQLQINENYLLYGGKK